MKTYGEKLKDPRWQKKRLEILQRDKWTCQFCGSTERSLVVHHLEYMHGKDPWEYENESLLTICEYCHNGEYEFRRSTEQDLLRELSIHKFSWSDIYNLLLDIDVLKKIANENEEKEFSEIDKFFEGKNNG